MGVSATGSPTKGTSLCLHHSLPLHLLQFLGKGFTVSNVLHPVDRSQRCVTHLDSLLLFYSTQTFRGNEPQRWKPVFALSHLNDLVIHHFNSSSLANLNQFFSNVERLRFRLAQSDPSSCAFSTANYQLGANGDYNRPYRPSFGSGPLYIHSHPRPRGFRNTSTTSWTRRHRLEKRSPQKLRKPASLQLANLVAQADSQCYHSLPAKLQQKLFSPEERRSLRLAYRDSVILDAADEAFYRRPNIRRRPSIESYPSEATLPEAEPFTVFWDSDTDSVDDSNPNMDQSLYDSFRCFDEDGELDLSLDEYHAHVSNAAAKKRWSRRHASFRQSLALSSHNLRHRPTASVPARELPPSQSLPPLAPLANRRSTSRPAALRKTSTHAPRLSTSSIDPEAQHYQDPDARFKLRVYLASPQKFDEAIEFGFPALHSDKENIAPGQPTSPNLMTLFQEAGTFFEEDDGTVVGTPGSSVDEEPAPPRVSSQMKETARSSVESPTLLQPRQSSPTGSKVAVPHRLPGNREMTLKMTLTRPDLRTESPTPSQSSQPEDPLQLAALPPPDRSQQIWDDLDDQGMVKKMWRKLRRRA